MKSSLICLALILAVPAIALADKVSKAADEYCECAKPAITEMNEMKAALQRGDMAAMAKMAQDIEGKMQPVQLCMNTLSEKYKERETDEGFKQKVTAQIEKQCPMPKMGMPQLAGMAGAPIGGQPQPR